MSEDDKKAGMPAGASVNQGIQARSITAGAIAVGAGATATQTVCAGNAATEVAAAVAALTKGLESLQLQPAARDVVQSDVQALEKEVRKPAPEPARVQSLIEGLAAKLKMVGVVVRDVAALAEPVRTIAKLFGVPMP